MLPKICSFSECGREVQARNLCQGHYAQQYKGRQLAPLRGRAATTGLSGIDRFWFYVSKSDSCWTWTAQLNHSGYGSVKMFGIQSLAHRIAYELEFGQIPDGVELDHKCHNPACVRPSHLQAVTHKVNAENRRGAQANSKSGVRGVTPKGNKWQAQVVHHGKAIYIGTFSTIAEAESAVIAKRNSLFTNNLKDRAVA